MARPRKHAIPPQLAAPVPSPAAVQADVPVGQVALLIPPGVTSCSEGDIEDGRILVPAERAEQLVKMHGFTRV